MNPTLEENIIRQRAHRSAIVLATLLTCLLFVTDRASAANSVTVVVPANLAHLHEDVAGTKVIVRFYNDQGVVVGQGAQVSSATDGFFEFSISVRPIGSIQTNSIFDATTYKISLALKTIDANVSGINVFCEANVVVDPATDPNLAHCNGPFSKVQWYVIQEGPISNLIPDQ